MLPLRERMVEEIRRLRSSGKSLESAIASARATVIAERDPETEVALKFLRRQSIPYLAHELFNRDWQPMEFGALARDLTAAGLEFAAEARPIDAFARLNFTTPQRAMLEDLDVIEREEMKDRLLARKFRRDYFRKADGALPATARPESHHLLLVRASVACDDIVAGASAVRIDPALVRHVVNSLRPGPTRIARLITARYGREAVLECVSALIRAECVVPVGADDWRHGSEARAADCRTLNARLLELSRRHPEASVLASPLTRAGVEGDRATLHSPETLKILGLIDEKYS